jgi:hypothetical protein
VLAKRYFDEQDKSWIEFEIAKGKQPIKIGYLVTQVNKKGNNDPQTSAA